MKLITRLLLVLLSSANAQQYPHSQFVNQEDMQKLTLDDSKPLCTASFSVNAGDWCKDSPEGSIAALDVIERTGPLISLSSRQNQPPRAPNINSYEMETTQAVQRFPEEKMDQILERVLSRWPRDPVLLFQNLYIGCFLGEHRKSCRSLSEMIKCYWSSGLFPEKSYELKLTIDKSRGRALEVANAADIKEEKLASCKARTISLDT